MELRCSHCNRLFDVDVRDAGRELECPFCYHSFICPKAVASMIPFRKKKHRGLSITIISVLCVVTIIGVVMLLSRNMIGQIPPLKIKLSYAWPQFVVTNLSDSDVRIKYLIINGRYKFLPQAGSAKIAGPGQSIGFHPWAEGAAKVVDGLGMVGPDPNKSAQAITVINFKVFTDKGNYYEVVRR